MSPDTASLDAKYQLFIEKVAASKLVWGLQDKKGWANSHAAEGEEFTVVPFWSERALAKACAKADWAGYTATDISLPEFLESWCIGMADDDILAGLEWDANMFGKEISALKLALDVLTRLQSINSAIKFSNYASIDEFIADIKVSIDE
jgi:hypothetical protein